MFPTSISSVLGRILALVIYMLMTLGGAWAQNSGIEVLSNPAALSKDDNFLDDIKAKISTCKVTNTVFDGANIKLPYKVVPFDAPLNALTVCDVKMHPTRGMIATIAMKIDFDQTALYFCADQVALSSDGKLAGDVKLYLLRSVELQRGSAFTMNISGMGSGSFDSTYVVFNCNGFKQLSLGGTIVFNEDAIKAKNPTTGKTGPLKLQFLAKGESINSLYLEFGNIPTFELTSLPNFECAVKKLVIDNDDQKSPNTLETTWKGAYLEGVTMKLPPAITDDPSKLKTIDISYITIGSDGVSFKASAQNVLGDGSSLKGFKMDISNVEINVSNNNITKGSINGSLVLPICKGDDKKIDYEIKINNDGFSGSASVHANIKYTAFEIAMLNITTLEFRVAYHKDTGQFTPSAVLSGKLDIGVTSKNSSPSKTVANLNLEFKNLSVSEKGLAIVKDGYFKSSGDCDLGALPVSVGSLVLKSRPEKNQVGLAMNVDLALSGGGSESQEGNKFSAKAGFTVWFEHDQNEKRWKYAKDFDLSTITVDVSNHVYALHGTISMFEDDPLYGQGFCGKISLDVIEKIKVEVAGIFGKKESLQYWFVDAAVTFQPITVFSGLDINSFSGGLYHYMKMDNAPTTSSVLCSTSTGRSYVPDKSVYLGLIAGLGVQSTGGGNAYNGKLNLGIEFNSSGGATRIATWGEISIMTSNFSPPRLDAVKPANQTLSSDTKEQCQSSPPTTKSAYAATWYVEYDVNNAMLMGDFGVYIDHSIVKGAYSNYLAGHAWVKLGKGQWYIYLGRPSYTQMIALNITNLATVGGYLCLGNELPNPRIIPLPEGIEAPVNSIDENSISLAVGMSLGMRMDLGGSFDAEFSAFDVCNVGASLGVEIKSGFDVLVSQSKNEVFCAGMTNARGINKWYATGTAFLIGHAYVKGSYSCGILGSGSATFMEGKIVSTLFGQLPNPTYLKGTVDVELKVLEFSGDFAFDVKYGDQCESEDNSGADVKIITSLTPANGDKDVSVRSRVNVKFARSLDFEFKTVDKSGDKSKESTNRFKLKSFVLKQGNSEITCTQKNVSGSEIELIPSQVLPENTEFVATVVVALTKDNEFKSDETHSVTFTTGSEPSQIATSDITAAYPVPKMESFYKNELDTGFIYIQQNLSKPYRMEPGRQFNMVFFSGNNEVARVTSVQFDGHNTFSYLIPRNNLVPGQKYTLKLTRSLFANNASVRDTTRTDPKTAAGTAGAPPRDIEVLSYEFKLSTYTRFQEKMAQYAPAFTEVFNNVTSSKLTKVGVSEPITPDEVSFIRVGNQPVAVEKLSVIVVNNSASLQNIKLQGQEVGCLLGGGCTSKTVTYKAGSSPVVLEYRIPGRKSPVSSYSFMVNVPKDIIIPN